MNDAAPSPRACIERHGKSFALASRLLPARAAERAAIIYAWCRRADDAIDEAHTEAPEHALLRLRAELRELYSGSTPRDPVLQAFGGVLRDAAIPWSYPAGLLEGMAMDVNAHEYVELEDLLIYGYRVASTVGLMMCHVMGVSHPGALRHAAHLGLAMQITNVCRDVQEDWQRGRLYLPDALLRRHGAGGLGERRGDRFPDRAVDPCRKVVAELLGIADGYYRSSDAGLAHLSWRCALGVDAARRIYASIGDEIARTGHDVRAPRAVVSARRKLWLCARAAAAALGRGLLHPARRFEPAALHTVQHGTELIAL